MSFFRLKSVVCRVGSAGLVALPMFLGFARTAAAAPRIVCIGEQTTMTTEMSPTWPAQMQIDLGAAYSVTDDGDGGGTVLDGSVHHEGQALLFSVRDPKLHVAVPVRYTGIVPDPFAQGRAVLVTVQKSGTRSPVFVGQQNSLTTKCPSKYQAASASY